MSFESIVNHSVRTYLHAAAHASRAGLVAGTGQTADFEPDLLFCACVLHDIGTADRFDGPQRFEVEGADAAAEFLTARGRSALDVDMVWEAIALHTSPGIAERRGPITMLVRRGVRTDFGKLAAEARTIDIERQFPRLEIERVLADAVVAQALRRPEKAPASSWPGGLLRAHQDDPSPLDGRNSAF